MKVISFFKRLFRSNRDMPNVAGEYECKGGKSTARYVFHNNGEYESYYNGEKDSADLWTISAEGELHVKKTQPWHTSPFFYVYRINQDGSITSIATLRDGKRTDFPKETDSTYIKIK